MRDIVGGSRAGWPTRGVREITLLGQNVNAYHGCGPDGRPWSLSRLIDRLAEIEGSSASATRPAIPPT